MAHHITNYDKYLSMPPTDEMDAWYEQTLELFSDEFYEANEDWLTKSDPNSEANQWLDKLFKQNKSPEEAAAIIESDYKQQD